MLLQTTYTGVNACGRGVPHIGRGSVQTTSIRARSAFKNIMWNRYLPPNAAENKIKHNPMPTP